MKNSNKTKNELLGMPYGTASNRLRKTILFSLVKHCQLDICYRCGLAIENIDDLSIEHKVAWQSSENPIEAFFDLDNISFSHLNCNVDARDKTRSVNQVIGENVSTAKLKNSDIKDIRELLASGKNGAEVAGMYKVSKESISAIKIGKTWKNI